MSTESMKVSPAEAVMLRTHPSADAIEWAEQIAKIYQATPRKGCCQLDFYTFIWDIFNAGRISGKREERARKKVQA